jgi:hypothetical protein
VALITLAVSACGGGGEGEQQQAKARPLPESAQDLRPGEYRTEEFKPSLSFTVGKGWALECPEAPDYVCLVRSGEYRTVLKFLNVKDVYKPSKEFTGETTPTPADLVGWFQQHPYLQTDKPEPLTVGGVKGERFDVVVGDLPTDYDSVDLYKSSYGDSWAVDEGDKNRITVLEDVKGETVTIFFGAPAAEFDEFWPKAKTVLKTVEWKGA